MLIMSILYEMWWFFKIVNPRPGNEFLNSEHFAKSHNGTQALKKQQAILLSSKGYINWNVENIGKNRVKIGIT